AGQQAGGGGDPLQRPQRPARHQVRAGDADDRDDQDRRQPPGQQLALRVGEHPLLPDPGVEGTAVGEHHLGTGGELLRRPQRLGDQQPGEQEQQQRPADQQDRVDQGEPQPDGGPQPPPGPGVVHGQAGTTTRYPAPTTVSIRGGSPSFLRRVITVTRTVVVNGSALASQTRSSSSSLDTTPPRALISSSRTPNSLRVRSSGLPPRVTARLAWSSTRSPTVSTGGATGEERRPSARTRATSSSKANGLVR